MKILLAVTNGDLSGAPVHVRDVAIRLARDGNDVLVVLGEDGAIAERLVIEGVKTVVMPSMRSAMTPVSDLINVFRAYRLVRSFCPDLVHAHSSKAGMIFRLASWLNNIPAIFTVHGWFTTQPGNGAWKFVFSAVERVLSSTTAMYIAVSNFDRLQGINRFGIPPSSIVTIHNGIINLPVQRNYSNPNSLRLIMVARDDAQKDYDTVFRAINGLPVHLLCVGRGTDSMQFKQRAMSLAPLSFNSIGFLGVSSSVAELLSESDIFVLSSHYEGLPISIIEAMREGLPIVATNVGGVSELVDESNGAMFQRNDHIQLAKILRRYDSDRNLIKSHGKRSQERFLSEFSFDQMIHEINAIYLKIKAQ